MDCTCGRASTHRNVSGHDLCDVCAFRFACLVTPTLVGTVLKWGDDGHGVRAIMAELRDVRRFA